MLAMLFGVLMHSGLALAQASPDHDGGGDFSIRFGELISRPDEKIGTWVISDTELFSYTANEETEVIGDLEVGMCVSVKTESEQPDTAHRIGAEDAEKCDDDGDGGDGEHEVISIDGILNSKSDETDTWVISGTAYTVNGETMLEGDLNVGACVEVEVNPSEPTVALKIEAEAPEHCAGGDDDGGDDGGGEEDFVKFTGILKVKPDEGNIWVVGEKEFTVTNDTEFEGEPNVGDCVEVKSTASEPNVAITIESQDSQDCGEDNGGDGGDETKVIYAKIDQRAFGPGIWKIGGIEYTVTKDTELEEEHGGLPNGACVAVTVLVSDPTTAIKIASQEESKCDDQDDNDDDDDENDDGHDGDGDHHGQEGDRFIKFVVLNTLPDDKLGEWQTSGGTFKVSEETELEASHGDFVPGVCVKVIGLKSEPNVALKIESEPRFLCVRGDDDEAKGTLFGQVISLPVDIHNGTWNVAGVSLVVSDSTELIDHGMEFTPGVTVKVDFIRDISDTNFARRIEIKFGVGNPCFDFAHTTQSSSDEHFGSDEGHGFGRCPGLQGRAKGIIETRPDGTLLGDWQVGGIPYKTNAFTKFGPGDYGVGDIVKIDYVVLDANTRFAVKVQQVARGVEDPNNSWLTGNVTDLPDDGFIGDWVIEKAPFVAVSDTIFIEHGSIFAPGAYVVVQYHITNNQRIISKIVTYVPPGAGDENHFGKLESLGAVAAVASVNEAAATDEVWTVDGVQYIVSDATLLVDDNGALQEGAKVYVNSYVDNGQRFATLISTQSPGVFIPMSAK